MLLFALILVVSFVAIFFVNKQDIEADALNALIEKARAITTEAENARNYVGDLWGTYDTFKIDELLQEVEEKLAATTPSKQIFLLAPKCYEPYLSVLK